MPEPVPVVMYHSVAPRIEGWAFEYLSIEPAVFEDHIRTLARAGYSSVFLSEVHAYVAGQRALPPKTIALTFDDGYLDNWVFAYPVLKKYGFKATIFVSEDFVDPRDTLRPTSEQGASEYAGFLSVPEMKALISSGVVDIQGHCKTHTWYFTGADIVDVHRPADGRPWLAWNARPDRKYLYLQEDQTHFVPLGSPVYAHERSLVARRWLPDGRIERDFAAHVADRGGEAFFARPDWKHELAPMISQASKGTPAGRHETDDERQERLWQEIVGSKRDLEGRLDKKIDFLCWPGGGHDHASVELARDAGYTAWTLGSRAVTSQVNVPGEDPSWIRRIAVVPSWSRGGRRICALDGEFVKLIMDDYKGFPTAALRLKAYKAGKLLLSYFR